MRKSGPLIECAKTGDAVLYPFSLQSDRVAAGPDWIHEVKHDGYRMMVVREQKRVRLISRPFVPFAFVASVDVASSNHYVPNAAMSGIGSNQSKRVQYFRLQAAKTQAS
jgi:hypothetical protein